MSTDNGTDGDTEMCIECWGTGEIKRRYGTVGSGPAKIVKRKECPYCDGTGERAEPGSLTGQLTEGEGDE